MSDYLENAWLDHVLGTAAYASPSTVYVQLHVGDPGETGAANPAATNTRVAASFAAPVNRTMTTDSEIDLGVAAANETLTDFTIWDALNGGNCLFIGTMTDVVAQTNDPLSFAAGDIDVALSGAFCTFLAQALLNHTLRNTAYAAPAGTFVKLHSGEPGLSAANNPATETTRVATGSFSAASGGAADNDSVITWTNLAATETVPNYSIWDAATGGNPLLQGILTTPKALVAGNNAQFAAGDLDLAFL